MTRPFTNAMRRATELTQAGKLHEATAVVQSALKGRPAQEGQAADGAITAEFTWLDPAGSVDVLRGFKTARPRKALGETLRRIAAGGMPDSTAGQAPAVLNVPPGATFLSLSHRSRHGHRDYRLYTPARRAAKMPLIVMLHGCTQTPEDFATGTGMNALAEEFGCLIAFPAQPSGANAQKCWNWFRSEDQVRDRGEPALIAGLTKDILRDHPADPNRIYIAGLSAGGAAAAISASAYPEIFSAVGVHSGLAVGAATDVPSAFAAMRSGSAGKRLKASCPTIVFHGLDDTTVSPGNGRAVFDQAAGHVSGLTKTVVDQKSGAGRGVRRTRFADGQDRSFAELWEIDGAGHAWAGGKPDASYTDPKGPDASREMLRFFLQHSKA